MVLVGFLFSLMVVEIGLYIVGYSYPILYVADEYRGWALRPDVSGNGTQEGHGFVKVNSDGLRDREYSKEKPINTLRVAVLGDSYAEAQHVDAENAFWSVMENELRRCPQLGGKNVESINFGVSSYGTAQELITLRHFAWDYSPDIVVLAFFSNDIRDNYLVGDMPRPYFFLQEDKLFLDNSFRELPSYKFRQSHTGKVVYFLVNHSRVLQLLKHANLFERAKLTASNLFVERVGESIFGAQTSVAYAQSLGTAPEIEAFNEYDAWVLTEKLLLTMNREVVDNGAELLIMVVTTDPVYSPDISVNKALNLPLQNYESRIADIGQRRRIPVLMLSPEFRKYAYKHKVHLHGFVENGLGVGHWNELGHDLAGNLASRFICENMNQ